MKRLKSRLKLAGAFGCLFFAVLISLQLFYSYCLQSSITRYKILDEYLAESEKAPKVVKHILFWTKFFDIPFWGMQHETYLESDLKALGCPETNCIFTHDKSYLKHPHDYDAIVFHGAEMWTLLDLPKTRRSNQFYVMASQESPGETKHKLEDDHDFYNLTMTYRLDSDIKWVYGKVVDIISGAVIAPAITVKWILPDEDFHDSEILALVEKKPKMSVWFVSHCETISRRDDLTRQLQQFTDVDVYGKCGTLLCPRSSNHCDEMLNTTYRFHLSFENTLCIDYVTEKLFKVMNHYVIPVVYSGADLNLFLPPKSYIDANEFSSPEELAAHLEFLAHNPVEYIKYFWWKKHYGVPNTSNDPTGLCNLCQKLNEFNSKYKKQSYGNIKKWFFEDACKKPEIKF